MSGTTWSKFFWSDWDTDPALRLCSMAAQGLWMRMLCIASAHDPIGYVAVAGRGLDETALARMTGCPESEVTALLGELDQNGVFSRDRQGRIYSRRMIADAKKAATARKNGKNGGNPNLRKQTENPASVKGSDKGGLKPQEPEAISHREKPPSEAKTAEGQERPGRLPNGWSPSDADRVFARSLGATEPEIDRTAGIFRDYWIAKSGKDAAKADWSATWRNWCRREGEGGRFTGRQQHLELLPTVGPPAAPLTEQQWRARLNWARENDDWRPQWGPLSGEPGCLIPEDLLTDPHRELFKALRAKSALQRKAG